MQHTRTRQAVMTDHICGGIPEEGKKHGVMRSTHTHFNGESKVRSIRIDYGWELFCGCDSNLVMIVQQRSPFLVKRAPFLVHLSGRVSWLSL